MADAIYIAGHRWGARKPLVTLPENYGLVPYQLTQAGRLQREREDAWNQAMKALGWRCQIDLTRTLGNRQGFWKRCGVAAVVTPYWYRNGLRAATVRFFLPEAFCQADDALLDQQLTSKQRAKPLAKGPKGFRTCPETGRILACSSHQKSPG